MIAQGRGQFEQAENWHRGELAISEEIGDKVGLGFSYHQLGVIAQLQGRRDDAEDWLRRALAIEQELGDTPGMALTLGQLGSLAERQGHDDQALELVIRCVSLFDEFPHELTEPGPAHLAQLTGRLGMAALEETWRQVTGNPLPPAVRDYVQANQPTTEG
jgi:tetratricopeptide (TPR) repeat protein